MKKLIIAITLLVGSVNFAQELSESQLDFLCDFYKQGKYEEFAQLFTDRLLPEENKTDPKLIKSYIDVSTLKRNILLKKYCPEFTSSILRLSPFTDIVDMDNIFNKEELLLLKRQIIDIKNQGLNVFLVTVSDYFPYKTKEDFSYNFLLENQNIFTKKGNLIILINLSNREIRISTDDSAKSILKDNLIQNTIESMIIPYFKEEDYFRGITNGLYNIYDLVK